MAHKKVTEIPKLWVSLGTTQKNMEKWLGKELRPSKPQHFLEWPENEEFRRSEETCRDTKITERQNNSRSVKCSLL